jgi:hypothetical protein
MNLQQLLMYLPILTEYFPYIQLLLQFRTADNAKRHEIVAQFYALVVTRLRPMFAERNDVPTTKLIDDILAAVRTYINDAASYGSTTGGVVGGSGSVGVNPVPPPVQVPGPLPGGGAANVGAGLVPPAGGYSGSWPAYPLEEEAHYKQPPMDPRWADITRAKHSQGTGGPGSVMDATPSSPPPSSTQFAFRTPPYDYIQLGMPYEGLSILLLGGLYRDQAGVTWPAIVHGDVFWTGTYNNQPAWQVLPAGYGGRPGWSRMVL